MPIYVDVSSAVHAKAGLGRYADNLVRALRPRFADSHRTGEGLALFQNSLHRLGPLENMTDVTTVGTRLGYKPWRGAVWLSQALRLSLGRLVPGATLFHATEHLLPYLPSIPTVLTVHDLIYQHLPEGHKALNIAYLRGAMPLFCRRADAIIAISQCTADDLVRLYGVEPNRITVIPEAAAPHFCAQPPERVESIRSRYGLPPRYLVTVGTIEPRKNLSRLVDACGPLFAADLVDALVIVGAKGWLYEGFFRHLEASPWQARVILPGFVADEDLPAVYAGALVCVQPSLYEGFGLPVLEAMACGTPVCAAGNSSMPEVGGDAALYVEPEDTEALAKALRSLLEDEALRADMSRRGLARAARFSWDETARQTLDLYRRTMERHAQS